MIACIIVTYNPDFEILTKCLDSILHQVDFIIIVNNSVKELKGNIKEYILEKTEIIELGNNFGIAYAQNRGIENAIKHNVDYVLLSDQDTIYPYDYVKMCISIYENYNSKENLGLIVPLFYNTNKKQMCKIMIKKSKAIIPEDGKSYFLAHAISSGSFIPVSVFKTVGFFNERLFIDYVDTEWCWRATKKQYKILCPTYLKISHSMGDSFKVILGKKFVVYSNFRYYFFFRNSYYLLFNSKLLSFQEFLYFFIYTKLKGIIFFITKGINLETLKLYIRAKYKGITNKFSLEEEIK